MSIPSFAVYGVSGTFTTYTWSEQSLGNSNHYAYAHDVHHDGFFHFLDTNPHRFKVVMSVWASVGIPQSVYDVEAYYNIGYSWYTPPTVENDTSSYNNWADIMFGQSICANTPGASGTLVFNLPNANSGVNLNMLGYYSTPPQYFDFELGINWIPGDMGWGNRMGGDYIMSVTINALEDGGGAIIVPNLCQMIIEQN
jgi:hypothetical protein